MRSFVVDTAKQYCYYKLSFSDRQKLNKKHFTYLRHEPLRKALGQDSFGFAGPPRATARLDRRRHHAVVQSVPFLRGESHPKRKRKNVRGENNYHTHRSTALLLRPSSDRCTWHTTKGRPLLCHADGKSGLGWVHRGMLVAAEAQALACAICALVSVTSQRRVATNNQLTTYPYFTTTTVCITLTQPFTRLS